MTIAQKIIKAHLISGEMTVGSEIALRIDQTLTQDATGTMAYLEFEAMGVDRVRTERSVAYIDHNTLQSGFENADDHRFIQSIAKKHGIYFSRPGNGICHQVHLERFGIPGKTLIGSDKPYFGYLYRNNLAIGARFGYTHMAAHFDNANVNLGNFINGIEFSTEGIGVGYLSNAYSFSLFHRAYVPLDRRGRFGVFGELELEGSYGRSKFDFMFNNEWNSSISDSYKVKFNFNPGVAAYIFPNVCATVSFGLGGLQYNHIKQFDAEMQATGTRNFSKLRFRLNITEINIGVTVHLWSKKNEQKLRLQ